MRIDLTSPPRFAWVRDGDHQAEAERIIAAWGEPTRDDDDLLAQSVAMKTAR